MREPPQPGDRIVVLYREGESPYGLDAVLATVVAPPPLGPTETPALVTASTPAWFRVAGHITLCRRLDEEGVEWARVTDVQVATHELQGGWTDVVDMLLAARQLSGIGE